MSILLHIAASPSGLLSSSYRAGREAIAHLQKQSPDLQVIERQLGVTPLPAIDADWVAASLMPAQRRGETENKILALSEQLIGELERSDAILISTPMHNFALPAVLKTWVDYIVRPHRTFGLSAAGKSGLLNARPVKVILSSGGPLESPSTWQADFVTPYLRHVFDTIGMPDLEIIKLDRMNRGPEEVSISRQRYANWLKDLRIH